MALAAGTSHRSPNGRRDPWVKQVAQWAVSSLILGYLFSKNVSSGILALLAGLLAAWLRLEGIRRVEATGDAEREQPVEPTPLPSQRARAAARARLRRGIDRLVGALFAAWLMHCLYRWSEGEWEGVDWRVAQWAAFSGLLLGGVRLWLQRADERARKRRSSRPPRS